MDSIDIKILECLKENSRMNASAISERINMSISAVIERIKKLESSGIIKQYTAIFNANLLGKNTMAFISITLEHPKYNESFREIVKRQPEIIECFFITGDFDYILKVITASTETLAYVLDNIKSIKGVSYTRTLVVLNIVKNEATISLLDIK